jgi:hypothetical protein
MSFGKEIEMNMVARCGDYSPRSFLQIEQSEHGFIIVCNIDEKRRWEAPNPRFCGAFAGGRSLETYRIFWNLYNELPTDGHARAFIPSNYNDGNRLIIMRNDDVVVATEDANGEYGKVVLIGGWSAHFQQIKNLYKAMEQDNTKEPLMNPLV